MVRLDPARRVRTAAPSLPTPRNCARAVVFGDAIWTVGGSPAAGDSHGSAGSAVVEKFVR